jgi:hypothetical protein
MAAQNYFRGKNEGTTTETTGEQGVVGCFEIAELWGGLKVKV